MDTRTIIGAYLGQTFLKLYKTEIDAVKLFAGSLKPEMNYFRLIDGIILKPKPVMISCGNTGFHVFYRHSGEEHEEISGLSMEELLVNAFILQSGWQETVIQKRDNYGRFPYHESLQFKFQFSLIPVVNLIYREICLRINAGGDSCIALSFSDTGSNVIFSHDIDRLYSGWYEGTGNLIKKPGLGKILPWLKMSYDKFIKGIDNYESGFNLLLQMLDERGIKSIFFFLSNRSEKDADYSLNDLFIRSVIERLDLSDHIIGIHSGYFTYRDEVILQSQVKEAERAFGRNIKHNRQHFLKFDLEKTPGILLNSGIEYDYSLGFAESACLRNSLCTPFYLFDFKNFRSSELVEIPLLFMDGTYSHYQKVKEDGMANPLEELFANAQGISCNVSVLFHNTAFTEFKYIGFSRLFEKMAEYCKDHRIQTDAHQAWPKHLPTA